MSRDTDVIIVGAGAAGLAAAMELQQLGLSFRLLEGSHRIGGRAYSEEIAPGVWFDLGCSYLHQGETNPFVEIAQRLGREIGLDKGEIFAAANVGLFGKGAALDTREREAYFAYCDESFAKIEAAAARGEDVAVAELVDLEHEYALCFAQTLAVACAADLDEISSVDLASFEEGADYPVRDGYGNLVADWAAGVPVTLNTRVERIDWNGSGASVETPGGKLRSRAVICTVSTAMLAAGEIEFTPGLPDWKMEAIHGLPTGTANKICLHFDRDVFGSEGRGYHNTWNDSGESAGFEASVMGQDTAVVFCGGRLAIWLEKQGPQAMTDYAVDRVAEVFGNDIRARVTNSIATAWNGDPWTRGSYSCALPGQARQRAELSRPLDNRLYFAGEATAIGANSCCHGAYSSGIRAARELVEGRSFTD